ncbi:hypothetical protein FACS1894185_6470 [Betaproteobacteria bacterium]|nr:hypothetical protein FACS1894185_6470 [Betaproteobacteria bacterium]
MLREGDVMKSNFIYLIIAMYFGMHCDMSLSLETSLIPETAVNCNAHKPPLDAGVTINHGIYFFVFPAHTSISDGYTGCQTLLADDGSLRWVLYFMDGYLTASQYEGLDDKLSCDYSIQDASEAIGECRMEAEYPFFRSDPISDFPEFIQIEARRKLDKLRECFK